MKNLKTESRYPRQSPKSEIRSETGHTEVLSLRMVAAAEQSLASEARTLWLESRELNRIFGAMWKR